MTGWGITWILKKYTLPVAFLLSAGSVIYLGADKQIFNLDYSPMVKSVSVMAREAAGAKGGKEILRSVKDIRFAADQKPLVYLYDTGDPDIQFYLGDIAANIHGEEALKAAVLENGRLILTTRNHASVFLSSNCSIVFESSDFILFQTPKRRPEVIAQH
jgi:hypothetical protein